MTRFLICSFILFIVFVNISCEDRLFDPEPEEQVTSSVKYTYTGYDTEGVIIIQGWLTLEIDNARNITGEWHFDKIGEPEQIGNQVGEGTLQGYLNNDNQITLDLNAGWRDNNVILIGDYQPDEFSGTWSWSNQFYSENSGTFFAERVDE